MAEIEIIAEAPLTMVELKEKLTDIKKQQDLSFRGNKTLDYLNTFAKISTKEAKEIRDKLKALDIIRLKERHIDKIIDVVPQDTDSLKVLFANENLTLKEEELQKILACVK